MKRALLQGFYGHKNFGDDLLLIAISNMLLQKNKCLITLSAKNNLPFGLDKNKIKTSTKFKPSITEVFFHNYLVYGGGGIIQEVKPESYSDLYKKNIQTAIAKLLGKKIYFISISIGPIKTKKFEKLAYKILKRADYIGVRDNSSKELLDNFKIKKNSVLVNDAALEFDWNIEQKEANGLGISLIPYNFITKDDFSKDQEIIKKYSSIVNNYLKRNPDKKVYLFEISGSEGIKDTLMYEYILSNTYDSQRIRVVEYSSNPLETIENISKCEVFIGMRLHALIIAEKLKIPYLAINYHEKIKGFAEMYGGKLISPEEDENTIIFEMEKNLEKENNIGSELVIKNPLIKSNQVILK